MPGLPGLSVLATHLRGALICAPWLAWLGLTEVGLSILLPVKIFAPTQVYDLSSHIAYTVWNSVQIIFETVNRANITLSGDELPKDESAIVIANHVAWTDFYMVQALAKRSEMLGRCRWFAKIQLRLVPFLGWGLWAMGMPMMSRNWTRDQRELDRLFKGIVTRHWPTWLISFSEATRFSHEKHHDTKVWCRATGRPVPKHLLYPRTKGFIATVQHLRKAPHVKAVYDLTIAYQHGDRFQVAPSIWDSLRLPNLSGKQGYRFHVHATRFLLDQLPSTDDGLAKWLEKRWIEKGEWLDFKKTQWETRKES